MKKNELNHLLNVIYYDFFILVRTLGVIEECDAKEFRFCGKMADMIHDFPKCDVNSDYFKLELIDYSNFLADNLDKGIFQQKMLTLSIKNS
ncbi:hypothetical protein [Enterococcus wangshanyuanii]|uniref:hypothetical protein n=1 Tax=Enterococcus wangshanyuanii TaxID=2005703 RepID=UPI000B4AD394|nr:hypothetical protein [Enterococcus wangshanyuanii]